MNSMKDTWAYIDVLSEDGIIQDKKVLNMIYYFVEKKSNVLQIIGSNWNTKTVLRKLVIERKTVRNYLTSPRDI